MSAYRSLSPGYAYYLTRELSLHESTTLPKSLVRVEIK